MTEAERITQEMMAAYSTSIRMGLDVSEEAKPIIFDPPRQEKGTINETRRAKALMRSMDRRPPRITQLGASITDDPAMGIRTVVGVKGLTRFYNYGSLRHPYEDKSFPGGFRSAKFQGIGYRLGQQLEAFPKGKTIKSDPLGGARSSLYERKSAGAITPEYPGQMYSTRTLKNRGGNFQPFREGRFGKSIPADKVYDAAKGGLQRLAAQDPPVVRPAGTYRIPGQVYDRGNTTRIVTPKARVAPGGGAMSMGMVQLADGGTQQFIRDNTPQKVARRQLLATQRSSGTNIDSRPSQGSDMDMQALKKEVKRSELIVSFDKAFAKARSAGKKEFTWRGKRYNTRLK